MLRYDRNPTVGPMPPRLLSLTRDALLALFYPERCQLCGNAHARPQEGLVCQACRESIVPLNQPACDRCGLPFPGEIQHRFDCPNCRDRNPAFSRARSAVHAKGSAREAIHLYKYHRAFWLEPFFKEVWVPAAMADLSQTQWDGVVPVPLHPVRQREREFNQAERLGRMLAEALAVPLRLDLVRRRSVTSSQTRLSRTERAENVRNAFEPGVTQRIDGTRWVVVDDVLTTGATTDAVAATLRQLGAAEVVVWTFARGV